LIQLSVAKYAYVDSMVNLFPGSGSCGQRGGAQETLVGLKLGCTSGNWGLFSKSAWRDALDFGGTVEYYASRNSTIRFNAGTTLIHYLQYSADPNQPP
jgi:hypothetical protein